MDPAKRILITGAGGRLGRLLYRAAERADLLDRFLWQSRTPRTGTPGHWCASDLTDPRALLSRVRAVVNLAGATPATANPADLHRANVDIAERLLLAAPPGCRVLLVSSAAIYGRPNPGQHPFFETDTPAPLTAYARSKVEMEEMARAHNRPETCILRLGNVAGADALLGQLTDAPTRRLELDIFPGGHGPIRSYIGPGQLLDTLVQLCNSPTLPPLLNLAAPGPVAMDRLLHAWAAARPGEAAFIARQPDPGAIQSVVLNANTLQKLVNFALDAATEGAIVNDLLSLREPAPC